MIARLPSPITADRPPLVPCGASLASSTGSPRSTLVRATRPCSNAALVKAPGGTLALGQLTSRRFSGPIGWPRLMSLAATTTCATEFDDCCISQREAATTAATPAASATRSINIARAFFMEALP